jgi:CPA2 family monovalent cation:H+ antiporter-2
MDILSRVDPVVGAISAVAILLVIIGFLLKKVKQPYIIGYIFIGVLFGENVLGIVKSPETIHHMGEIGILLLLFFIGLEISLPKLVQQWKIAAVGTTLQVVISVVIMFGIGYIFGWQIQRIILLGFVIALSSSAVIIKLLQDNNLLDTKIGKNVLSILLTQDIIIVPMLICTSLMGGKAESVTNIMVMIIGGILFILTLVYIYKRRRVRLPFSSKILDDHELQVFLAIIFCFGGALLTSLFGLSPALGAFVGGMYLHSSKSTAWIHDTLHAFRVIFVAFFFAGVGLPIDFRFIAQNWLPVILVLLTVYVTNHFINTIILRVFDNSWFDALLGGAYLAQIGELSFLLVSSSFYLDIIGEYEYKFTISLISLTLLISPFWIKLTEIIIAKNKPAILSSTPA